MALSSAGITALLLIVLWYSTYLLVNFILKSKTKLSKFIALITSSFIISNEIIKNYLVVNNTVIWAELFMILAFYFYLRFFYETKAKFLVASLVCTSATLIMFHSFLLTICLIFLYSFGVFAQAFFAEGKKKTKILLKLTSFLILLFFLNSYFLVGNFSDLFNNNESILASYENDTNQTDVVMSSINKNYNDLGFNIILARDALFSKYPPIIKSINIINYFIIIIIAFSAILVKGSGQGGKIKKRILILFIIYVVAITLSFGPKDPIGLFSYLWKTIPGFKLFRDFFKFHWIAIILIPILCSYTITKLMNLIEFRYSKKIRSIALIVIILVFLLPLSSFYYIFQYSKPFKIPDGYFNLNYFINNRKSDNRILVMPIISWMQKCTWSNQKYDMVDPLSTQFLYKSVFVNGVLYEEKNNEELNKVMVDDFSSNKSIFYKYASLRNIKYLIIRDDLNPEYAEERKEKADIRNEFLDTKNLIDIANYEKNVIFLAKFNELYLYKLDDNVSLPHLYVPLETIISSRPVDDLPRIISDPELQMRPAFFFGGAE